MASAEHLIAVENPATGTLVSQVPVLGPEEIAAMAARDRARAASTSRRCSSTSTTR